MPAIYQALSGLSGRSRSGGSYDGAARSGGMPSRGKLDSLCI
jgi:hypothetical protein